MEVQQLIYGRGSAFCLMGLSIQLWSRSFTSCCMFCSLCSKKSVCICSVQLSALPDALKGGSVTTERFWGVFKLKKKVAA